MGKVLPFHRALVTGASAGIGAVFAERLARDGCSLVLVARDRQRLESLAQQLRARHHIEATVLPADLTQEAGLATVSRAIEADDALDLLVNNAGFATLGRFADLDPERETDEISLNILAVVRLARSALPGMLARRHGAMINVSSLSAFQPGPFNATYAATKAYIKSFSEALAEEVSGTGVRVQVLCPGFIRTEFQQRAGLDTTRVPKLAWMTPEAVVERSLADLGRNRVVCVPGLGYRVLAALARTAPRALVRRVVAGAGRGWLT